MPLDKPEGYQSKSAQKADNWVILCFFVGYFTPPRFAYREGVELLACSRHKLKDDGYGIHGG